MKFINYRELDSAIWQKYFSYDSETGAITNRWGRLVGAINAKGYLNITARVEHEGLIVECAIRAHQLAWVLMTGNYCEQIDHKDRNKLNNKWTNLREATTLINNNNRKVFSKSKSGVTGVIWQAQRKLWQAYIIVNSRNIHLGFTPSLFEAVCLRKSGELKYGVAKIIA